MKLFSLQWLLPIVWPFFFAQMSIIKSFLSILLFLVPGYLATILSSLSNFTTKPQRRLVKWLTMLLSRYLIGNWVLRLLVFYLFGPLRSSRWVHHGSPWNFTEWQYIIVFQWHASIHVLALQFDTEFIWFQIRLLFIPQTGTTSRDGACFFAYLGKLKQEANHALVRSWISCSNCCHRWPSVGELWWTLKIE